RERRAESVRGAHTFHGRRNGELHRERVGALQLLELAFAVAAVEVDVVAIVALFVPGEDAVAARVARRIARPHVGRLAGFVPGFPHVDAAVAADGNLADVVAANFVGAGAACGAVAERRTGVALLASAAT